jgi:hypothetical protein
MPTAKRGRGRPRQESNILSDWIDSTGRTRKDVAIQLKVAPGHLDQLCASRRRPDIDLAFRIEDLTDGAVPARFWTSVSAHSSDD